MEYKTILNEIENDNNYCTIASACVVFDLPFKTVRKEYEKHGRKRGQGYSPFYQVNRILAKKHGFKIAEFVWMWKYGNWYKDRPVKYGNCGKYVLNESTGKHHLDIFTNNNYESENYLMKRKTKLTLKNFDKYLSFGDYIFLSRGSINHAIGVKNNRVEDWTKNRNFTIDQIYKIDKINKPKKSSEINLLDYC